MVEHLKQALPPGAKPEAVVMLLSRLMMEKCPQVVVGTGKRVMVGQAREIVGDVCEQGPKASAGNGSGSKPPDLLEDNTRFDKMESPENSEPPKTENQNTDESLYFENSLKPQSLMDELADSGVKYNPEDVIAVVKSAEGKLVWLEKGSKNAGLKHIIVEHADDFLNRGITQEQIPNYLIKALANGKIHRVAITVGNIWFYSGC